AVALARGLARYRDPDQVDAGAGLPRAVRLLETAGVAGPSPEELIRRWSNGGVGLDAMLGVTAAGPMRIDLAAAGPHALVAGTTGSGKSELLRTLVASLALAHDPEHVNFVLVDYKGGSAFDAAVRLPHTVGLVTDLDGGLADRALHCLEAELRHRERELRTLGAPDIERFRRLGGRLPRMLIVVDELAALARELPRFVGSLVDIAARGRSLGIHLVLATQRPAGVVGDAIRANTDIRIALRVTDRADSTDVLGDPAAAAIGRDLPGRGLVRLGPGDLVPFQAATVSAGPAVAGTVTVRPFQFGHDPGDGPQPAGPAAPDPGPTDLERLSTAAVEAVARLGLPTPRRPWPEPLPGRVDTDDLPPAEPGDGVLVGLADEPDRQRTVPFTWSPAEGNLGLYGAPGSGLTTALETVVLGLVAGQATDPVDIYVVDGPGDLGRLSRLAAVGGVVSPGEVDRIARLVRMLLTVIDRRRAPGGRRHVDTATVLVVDGREAVLRSLDTADTAPARDGLLRVIAEGVGVDLVTVFATSRPGGLPAPVEAAVAHRLVLRQSDPLGAAVLGVRGVDDLAPGRAVHAGSNRSVQIAVPGSGLAFAAEAIDLGARAPVEVGVLPEEVGSFEVEHLVDVRTDRWTLPVGIGDSSLAPVGVMLRPGDHVLVVGGPGAGKTTLLAALAGVVHRRGSPGNGGGVRVLATGQALTGLVPEGVEPVAAADLADLVAELIAGEQAALLLVDDADTTAPPDLGGVIEALLAGRRPSLHLVVAARPAVKALHGHWARGLAASRTGIWLSPSAGVDADLWHTPLPWRFPVRLPPGRGLLVANGGSELVQLMRR
ncbi:MAG: FtsK/SpoIIIE domain-containing protein, partial [Acidimicrobiia bacterium]